MVAPKKVAQLIEVFARNIDVYKISNYDETRLCGPAPPMHDRKGRQLSDCI